MSNDQTPPAPAEQTPAAAPAPAEQTPAAAPAPRKKRGLNPLTLLLCKVAILAAMVTIVLVFVAGIHIHEGNGMYPFLMDGDLVVTYKLEPYRTGDVVAYRHPVTGETAFSRIVAVGENTIHITADGELLINGNIPDERVFYPTLPLEGDNVEYPYIMRKGGYFVLDDYRTGGDDSRRFGQLLESELLGKVVYVFRRRGI